jgi:hypothetical protein
MLVLQVLAKMNIDTIRFCGSEWLISPTTFLLPGYRLDAVLELQILVQQQR